MVLIENITLENKNRKKHFKVGFFSSVFLRPTGPWLEVVQAVTNLVV